MSWSKEGVLLAPPTHLAWSRSHASVPAVDMDDGGAVMVYFTTRDESGRSQVGRARVDLTGAAGAEVDPVPVLLPGRTGAFDDSGAMTSCIVRHGGEIRLYYTGWSLGVTVPFYLSIGCAVSRDDGQTFERISESPILGRSAVDPFLTASPFVLFDAGQRFVRT